MNLYFEEPLCKNCILTNRSVFRKLTPEEMEFITARKTCASYKKGALIYKEGQRISGIYCISSGVIKIFKTGIAGKEQIIKFGKPGDIFGYRSIMNGEPACTSVRVHEDAVVCHIIASDLYALLKKNNEFAIDLLQLACVELGEANNFITDIAQKNVKERLAEILILLKNEFGTDAEGTLKISLTREEIANLIGTATESVIRLLSEFKTEKMIELKGRRIRIVDEVKLRNTGNL